MIRTNQYDALNRLVKTETQDAQQGVLASFAYGLNAAHQRTSVTNAAGAYWVYQYDSLGQVTSGRRYWANGTPVLGQQFDYTFDDIGNRKTAVTGGDASGHNRRYQHDTANSRNQYEQRLVPGYLEVTGSAATNATVTLNNQAVTRQGEYFWGELGLNNSAGSVWLNLTNLGVLAVSTNSDVAVTNTGQLFLSQTPEAFGHDADANLTRDGRWTYTWDAENRLVRMVSRTDTPTNSWRSLTFGYDPQGRRISKTVSNWVGSAWQLLPDERFVYDRWNCLAILHSSFSLLHSFTWGLDLSGSMQGAGGVGGLLWLDDPSHTNVAQFVASDGNGNVAALICATNGAVTANYEYGPFGEVIRATGPMAKANPFRFSTKYQDEESDLLYYGYRYYNAGTGRWISRDPIGENGGANIYACVWNDCLNKADSTGLFDGDTGGSIQWEWRQALRCNCKGVELRVNVQTDQRKEWHEWPDKLWVQNEATITIPGIGPILTINLPGGHWVPIAGWVNIAAKCRLPRNNYTLIGWQVTDWGTISSGLIDGPKIRCNYQCNFSIGTLHAYDHRAGEGSYERNDPPKS